MEIVENCSLFHIPSKWIELDENKMKELCLSAITNADIWILDRASFFSPILDWIDKEDRYLKRKSFAELAIYLYVADEIPFSNYHKEFQQTVINFVNSKDFYQLIKRYPKQLLLYGAAVNYVKHVGALSTETQNVVNSVLDRQAVWSIERVPHRMLDLWNFLQVYGAPTKPLCPETILELSCIHFLPDAIESTLHDAYALTHNLLFYYNFGVSFGKEQPRLNVNLEDVLVKLILRYSAENNFDIVLELLYVAAMHRQLPKWVVNFVLCLMNSDGAIEIKGPKGSNAYSNSARSEDYQQWANNYHTVLVAASTFRYLYKNWDSIDAEVSEMSRFALTQEQYHHYYALGATFVSFAEYEIPLAAYQAAILQELNKPVLNYYLVECVDFIKFQRNYDGTYGSWPDEETLYLREGGSKESFVSEVVEPVVDLCERVMRNLA